MCHIIAKYSKKGPTPCETDREIIVNWRWGRYMY